MNLNGDNQYPSGAPSVGDGGPQVSETISICCVTFYHFGSIVLCNCDIKRRLEENYHLTSITFFTRKITDFLAGKVNKFVN